MKMILQNVGQVLEADLELGDLTVLVGPQATGKSIALQFLRLMVDLGYVQQEMQRYGLDWDGDTGAFFDAYFGEGMHALWTPESEVRWQGRSIDLSSQIGRMRRDKSESMFFIPAQRVLTMREGWPRPFSDYSAGDPFAVRDFSETLRVLIDREFSGSEGLFPQERRLKKEFRRMLERTIFSRFRLSVDKVRSQKRLVLGDGNAALPFMVWSAGQREFVPLLLGLYWLMPPSKTPRRGELEWVVLEEIEMGLHPRAISVLMLLVLELVARGYRVCLSTHSPQVLETVWALKYLRQCNAPPETLLKMFDSPITPPMIKLAKSALAKSVRVHYFDPSGVTRDISSLDVDHEESGDSGWGGLSEFSSRANEAVARAVANAEGSER